MNMEEFAVQMQASQQMWAERSRTVAAGLIPLYSRGYAHEFEPYHDCPVSQPVEGWFQYQDYLSNRSDDYGCPCC